MKKRVLCFGDSNTWGYDGQTGLRFDEDTRWTGLLQSLLGPEYAVLEEGQNGRTTVFADPVEGSKSGMAYLEPCLETANPLQAVVIMLGTNDAKDRFGCNAYQISQSVKRLGEMVLRRDYAPYPKPELLIVSPIEINGGILAENDDQNFSQASAERSIDFSGHFADRARELGCHFLDAAAYAQPGLADGVHLDAENHAKLAEVLYQKLMDILE